MLATTEAEFRERILARQPVRIRGGGSKDFYGGPLIGDILDTRAHGGIINYEPSELVITARAGTPLAEIKSALATRRQMLAFEPPAFAQTATLGGVVACGLSGPRRMAVGSVRDFVLGVRLMNGTGEVLKFGGEVMKNVAGYDVSRLLTGSLGTLGLILDVSLKVLPQPVAELTLQQEASEAEALALMNRCAALPLPVSASCWFGGVLQLRLSGAAAAVRAAHAQLGGEILQNAESFWESIREQHHAFFAGDEPLWRLCVPPGTAPLGLASQSLMEWNGSQRWLRGDLQPSAVRDAMSAAGGHARLFRGASATHRAVGVFRRLPPPVLALHQRLKAVFDPHGVFNPQRMYPEF